jgi:hypothetical protein
MASCIPASDHSLYTFLLLQTRTICIQNNTLQNCNGGYRPRRTMFTYIVSQLNVWRTFLANIYKLRENCWYERLMFRSRAVNFKANNVRPLTTAYSVVKTKNIGLKQNWYIILLMSKGYVLIRC